jgi:hypothetical protein
MYDDPPARVAGPRPLARAGWALTVAILSLLAALILVARRLLADLPPPPVGGDSAWRP